MEEPKIYRTATNAEEINYQIYLELHKLNQNFEKLVNHFVPRIVELPVEEEKTKRKSRKNQKEESEDASNQS